MCAEQSRHWGHHIEPEAYTVALGGLEQRNDMLWYMFHKGPADCSADLTCRGTWTVPGRPA